MTRLTEHVKSRNRKLMFKRDFNKTNEKDGKLRIFTTFVYKLDYKNSKERVEDILGTLRSKGYKLTKYYLSNIS